MATIVQSTASAATLVKTAIETTLTGTADNFTYVPNSRQILTLRNPTAGAITAAKLVGTTATTVAVAGAIPTDVSTGLTIGSIGIGATRVIQLDQVSAYLSGVCSVTGGTGLVAVLTDNT